MSTQNIFSSLRKHRVFLLIATFFAGTFLLGFDSAFAIEPTEIPPEDIEKVVNILNGFITGAAALMGMVTGFITMFLYPGWVNGTLFGLQDYLKIMWILISNIVYFIFAFILIAIAFMNIIGKGEGTWELKQAMPKFIIGVLIVPFSWFFVQFILSLSAILTVGVLTLPYDSFQGNELFDNALENEELAGKEICKDIVISFNGDFSEIEGGGAQLGTDPNDLDENIKCKSDESKITIKELLTGTDADGAISSDAAGLQNSIFGVMSIYSYGILKIDQLDTIDASQLKSIKTIADLIFKIVFDVLFIAVYLLLMIALLLALFVRGVRLWVYMMLSPVFGLLYFFGKESEGFGESGKAFNIKEFIALALVPVYVSAALAFGLVFILLASEGIDETNKDEPNTMKAGGFSLTILGAHGGAEGATGNEEKAVIGKLIVEIFGIVILWIAVMAALGASDTTKAIVEPIAAFGKSVGDLAAKAPTYAPIIPTGNGQMQSAASLKTIGSSIQTSAAGRETKRAQSFMQGMGGDPQGVANLNAAAGNAADSIARLTDKGEAVKQLRDLLRNEGGNAGNVRNSPDTQRAIRNAATTLDMTEINGVEIANLRFDSETDVANILAAIDKQAEEGGLTDSQTLFAGKFARGGLDAATYNRWANDGVAPNAPEPPDTVVVEPVTSNNINLTAINTTNAAATAATMTDTISERVLRAELVLADVDDDQHDDIVAAFTAASKIE